MEAKTGLVTFIISEISIEQFAIIESAFDKKNEEIRLSTNVIFSSEFETSRVAVDFRFEFEQQKERPFLIIDVKSIFIISPDSWKELKHGNGIIISKQVAIHLATLSVGNVRGVLHAKTENTPFNQFIIPLINIQDLVPEDISIEPVIQSM